MKQEVILFLILEGQVLLLFLELLKQRKQIQKLAFLLDILNMLNKIQYTRIKMIEEELDLENNEEDEENIFEEVLKKEMEK